MQELGNSLIDSAAQCWTCPVFDTLFAIISDAAGAAYQRLTIISVLIFCVLLAFYVLNVFWKNIKSGGADNAFQKTLKPVIIKSLIALTLLSAGLLVPRLISTITFEPAAEITLEFSKTLLPSDYVIPDDYNAVQLSENGFFNPELRDTIIKMLQVSVSSFQVYIKTGLAIMDAAYSLSIPFTVGDIIRHTIVFFIGLFLTYNFVKLFIKYSFCFMDVIVAMAMFAFFFPISVVLFIFKDAEASPDWMKKMGGSLGVGQIKKLIDAIVSICAAILTYTVIMLIIRGFLNSNGVDADAIQNSTDALFNFDLENSSAMELTFSGAIVLVYVINYIADQIPKVSETILSSFGVKIENSYSKKTGEDMWKLTNIVAGQAKNITKTVFNRITSGKNKENKSDSKEGKK
ncbi:MAG: hypothetical protein IJQ55_04260 [Alphaproteobacteria bacterium]|nr:hypothetical protein [Alphaproteobacteria bacterium]